MSAILSSQHKQVVHITQVDIHDLEKRFRSKSEMHDFLAHEGKVYLPKLKCVSIFFLKQVFLGGKDVS